MHLRKLCKCLAVTQILYLYEARGVRTEKLECDKRSVFRAQIRARGTSLVPGGGGPPISEVEFYACLERPQEILYGQIKGGETETGRVGGFMTLPNVRTFRTHVRLQHSNCN